MSLEEIKKRRLEELQNRNIEQSQKQLQEEIKLQQQIDFLESLGKQYLTKEALQRYGNLRVAYPEKAIHVMTLIVQLSQSGQLNEKIDDVKFKELLRQLDAPKKEFKLRRV